MIFRKLLTNGKIMLIVMIALCTAIDPELENKPTVHLPDLMPPLIMPSFITPLHYDAKIRFSYRTNDIIGECNISIVVNHRTKNISMHPVIFTIFEIALYDHVSAKQINIPRYSFNNKLNMLTIEFTTSKLLQYLSPGKYTLMMAYTRNINNNKKHFSASLDPDSYETSDNMLTATGVDIITPRELFPCWEKIAFNSTFKISIKHHKNYTALSNMLIQTTENDDKRDMMWTHFAKSPLMFIEHIKVVITSFINISTSDAYVTLWGREETINYLQLAQCIGKQVLNFLKRENFNIDKLPKLDYVAFWDTKHNNSMIQGLIIYRETDILYENSDPIGHKFEVSYLVINQIVSLWYDDVLLWSKKGFVTFLAAYIFYQIPLIDDTLNLFITETQQKSFAFDTASNANKINLLSYSPEYIKSSNIWRMLYHLITADVFWTGIRTYDTNNQFDRNNQTNDLWNIMQTILHTYSDKSNVLILKELISIWIAEKYYPVLYVTRNHLINKTIFDYLDFIDEDRKHLPTFVTYTTRSTMNFHEIFANKSFWLSPQKPETLLEKFDANDWIIVNLKQTGYYRVNYDTDNWLNLAQYMNSTKYNNIHILNRAQIIDDAFYFYTHKQLDYIIFWKISAFLSRETNYVVWYPMFKAFEYMTIKVSIKEAEDVKKNMKTILSGVLQKIGYNIILYEGEFIECLREEAVKWACIIGEKHCKKEANMQMTKDFYSNDNLVTQEWKKWMYCNGLASANNTNLLILFRNIWIKWETTFDVKFLEYLTCYEDLVVITDYLTQILQNKYLLKHNNTRVYIFFLTVAKHVRNDKICDFILDNLNKNTLVFTFNTQADKIAILIVMITHQHRVQQLEKVLEFVKTNLKFEEQIIDAVRKKIKIRRNEHKRKVNYYGSVGLPQYK